MGDLPSLLGPANQLMIGRVLSDEFFENRDWPVARAVAILILIGRNSNRICGARNVRSECAAK